MSRLRGKPGFRHVMSVFAAIVLWTAFAVTDATAHAVLYGAHGAHSEYVEAHLQAGRKTFDVDGGGGWGKPQSPHPAQNFAPYFTQDVALGLPATGDGASLSGPQSVVDSGSNISFGARSRFEYHSLSLVSGLLNHLEGSLNVLLSLFRSSPARAEEGVKNGEQVDSFRQMAVLENAYSEQVVAVLYVCLFLVAILASVCIILWRRLGAVTAESIKTRAVTEGARQIYEIGYDSGMHSYAVLLEYCLVVTGGTSGYLVMLTPEPHLVYSLDETLELDCAIAMDTREFWAPLFGGDSYVLQNTPTESFPYCGYPSRTAPVTNHLAVCAEMDGVPTGILGVRNASKGFTRFDAHRAADLLQCLWSKLALGEFATTNHREANLLEQLLDTMPMGVGLVDERGMLLRANVAALEMHGLETESLPVLFSACVAAGERSSLEDALMEALNSEDGQSCVRMQHRRMDASHFATQCTINRLDGIHPARLLVTIEDMSNADAVERQLRDYQESLESMVMDRTVELSTALHYAETTRDRLGMFLRSIGEGLLVTDMQNRVQLTNRKAEEMLDVSLPQIVGRQVGQALGDVSFRALVEEMIARTRSGEGGNFEFAVPAPDGSGAQQFIRATTSIVRKAASQNGSSVPEGVVTIMHDATKERELDTMKTEFISMAAHELRTPLTTIQGFSELLLTRDSLGDKERTHFLTHINNSAQTLTGIVSDLLDISRIEAGMGFRMSTEHHDLREIVEKQVDVYRKKTQNHDISLSMPEVPVMALVDSIKFTQVTENLLSNALKYSPKGGDVHVVLDGDDSTILLTVQDDGIGMDEAEIGRAFEKFYRAHSEDGDIQGTGLGLPIVKHLIEAHGGSIWLESEPDKGTTAFVRLPTARLAEAMP